MRKTTKTKKSSKVASRVPKQAKSVSLKPVNPAPTLPAVAPITFNDPFPVNIQKPDTTADTASLAPEAQKETNF